MSEFPHFSGCIYVFMRGYTLIKKQEKVYDNPAYEYVTLRPFAYIFLQLGKLVQKHKVKKRWHNAAGGWFAVSVRHTGRIICFPGGVVSC